MEPKYKKFKALNNENNRFLPKNDTHGVDFFKQKREEKKRRKEDKLIRQWEEQKKKEDEAIAEAKRKEEEDKIEKLVGRHYTVSIALPGSVMDNAQSPELRSYLAGQIARAAAVFCVDEIVVFDETNTINSDGTAENDKKTGCLQLKHILEYLECPQYLRKALYKKHHFLIHAGLLNPIDSPHHMRVTDNTPYREGLVLNKPVKEGKGSFADVGLPQQEIQLDKYIAPNSRITVKMDISTDAKKKKGKVVSPSEPREKLGLYWGYTVRLARNLGEVITGCPFQDGYDLTIGTSDRGESVDNLDMFPFRHLLVVFGGLHGLEASLEADPNLDEADPSLLFHHYLNTCPHQGSRTIRTEEAILITMSALRSKIVAANKTPSVDM